MLTKDKCWVLGVCDKQVYMNTGGVIDHKHVRDLKDYNL